ncbi:MAG: DsrE family protein [Deltaproteobacteria bacterium]|nr:DsrE family protein [Deltaproteobacteria bacterium]
MASQQQVVVVLTTGRQDRGARATLAFGWACTALAAGASVSLFLTIDGAIWALRNAAQGIRIEGYEPLHNYLEQFLALDGELLVCAPCTKYYCGLRDGEDGALHPAAKLAGLMTVVARASQGAQVVTF